MKITAADVSRMPATLEEAALTEQHKTAVDQRRAARQARTEAQKDAIEKRRAAAHKLHQMASATVMSGVFQAALQIGDVALSGAQYGVDKELAALGKQPAQTQQRDALLGKRQGLELNKKMLGVLAKLDGFAFKKAELEAEKADIDIEAQRAESAAQRAGEEVGEARDRTSKIERQIEDMNRIRHETQMASIRR